MRSPDRRRLRLVDASAVAAALSAACLVAVAAPTPAAASGSWSPLNPMPTARSGVAAATAPDGTVYALGGFANGQYLATAESFSPATGAWTAIAPMPTARAYLAAVTGPDGLVYAMGGFDGTQELTTVEVYSPTTGTWSAGVPLPTATASMVAVTGADARIYLLGGQTAAFGDVATVTAFTPRTGAWQTMTPMPTPRAYLGAAVGIDGRIYAMGGFNAGALATVEAYSPGTNTWTTVAPLHNARYGLAAAAGRDGNIYAVGGCCSGSGAYLTSVEAHAPGGGGWTAAAPLSTARYVLAATPGADGSILALGGCCDPGANALPTVEEYLPPDTQPVTTGVTVRASSNPTAAGVATTFAASVFPVSPPAGVPSGSVTFLDGATTIGSARLSGAPAVAELTTTLAGGVHSISARYTGDGVFGPSTAASTLAETVVAVTAAAPATVGQGASLVPVTITGLQFSRGLTASVGGGVALTSVKYVNPTTIKGYVSAAADAALGPHDVVVTVPNGVPATCGGCIVVSAAPAPASLSPALLQAGAYFVTVTINGQGFSPGTLKVTMAGPGSGVAAANPQFVTSTQITVKVSVAATASTGNYDVTVTNPDGGVGSCTGCFTVAAGPTLTSMTPGSVTRGHTYSVTLHGSLFSTGANITGPAGVTFKKVSVSSDDTTITAQMTVTSTAATGTNLVVTVINPAAAGSGRASCACLTVT